MTTIKTIRTDELKGVLEEFMGDSLKNMPINVVTSAEINKELLADSFKDKLEGIRESAPSTNRPKFK